MFNKFKYITLLHRLQEKKHNGKNRLTFNFLLLAGWSPADARRGLIRMNRIKLVDLVKGHHITSPSLQKTLLGKHTNTLAKQLTARSVNIPVNEFYPEDTHVPNDP